MKYCLKELKIDNKNNKIIFRSLFVVFMPVFKWKMRGEGGGKFGRERKKLHPHTKDHTNVNTHTRIQNQNKKNNP